MKEGSETGTGIVVVAVDTGCIQRSGRGRRRCIRGRILGEGGDSGWVVESGDVVAHVEEDKEKGRGVGGSGEAEEDEDIVSDLDVMVRTMHRTCTHALHAHI